MHAGNLDLLLMASTRALTTSLMHGCTTALIGYGLYLVKDLENNALPSMMLGLYATSVTVHAIYNLLVMYSARGKLIAVLFPIIMAFALLLVFYRDEIFEPDSKESHDDLPHYYFSHSYGIGIRRLVPISQFLKHIYR